MLSGLVIVKYMCVSYITIILNLLVIIIIYCHGLGVFPLHKVIHSVWLYYTCILLIKHLISRCSIFAYHSNYIYKCGYPYNCNWLCIYIIIIPALIIYYSQLIVYSHVVLNIDICTITSNLYVVQCHTVAKYSRRHTRYGYHDGYVALLLILNLLCNVVMDISIKHVYALYCKIYSSIKLCTIYCLNILAGLIILLYLIISDLLGFMYCHVTLGHIPHSMNPLDGVSMWRSMIWLLHDIFYADTIGKMSTLVLSLIHCIYSMCILYVLLLEPSRSYFYHRLDCDG